MSSGSSGSREVPEHIGPIHLRPGARSGRDPWYWHLVEPLLREAGHEAVAVRLPVDNASAGLQDHADAVRAAVDGRDNVVLVAQSLGAQVAPLACDAAPIRRIVLVAPMIPAPGETGGAWWTASGQAAAARELDLAEGRDPDAPFDPSPGATSASSPCRS
jgi:alpha-beta hydrolase superfamily lysophospholipase